MAALESAEALTAAEVLAKRSKERLVLLQELADALAFAETERDMASVAFVTLARLGAVAGVVTTLVDDHLDVLHAFGLEGPFTRLGPTSREAAVIARGEPLWLENEAQSCWIGVPLQSEGGRVFGTLSFTLAPGMQYDDDARSFLASVIDCSGRALSRARLDESERIARRAAHEAEAEAKRLATLQEQLVAEVAHDLRTPLTAIKLSVATLLAGGALNPVQARKLTNVEGSIARICDMLHTLRDFTQARLGGGIPIKTAPLDVARHVMRAAAEIEAAHPGRSIHVTVEGDVAVEADDRRLMQVLSNLLGNAIQHGGGDAPVNVAVRRAGDNVVLQVHNDGPAIPTDLLPNLFQPFRQGELSRKSSDATGSLGLGLFIVQEVVHAHGGKVSVDSSSDRGTTFTVELHARKAP